MDDYEVIRRQVLVEQLNRWAAARQLGHSRKTTKKALENNSPPGYRPSGPAGRPVIDPARHIIDTWLEKDSAALAISVTWARASTSEWWRNTGSPAAQRGAAPHRPEEGHAKGGVLPP